uniref:Flap endonuclease GEN-like 2 n=1 Tax=Rhizophora mucronata TaxID=61149 RepID=A0A2P2K2M5_RHIMU
MSLYTVFAPKRNTSESVVKHPSHNDSELSNAHCASASSTPSRQGIPSACPRTFASFTMRENSDPMFLRSEHTFSRFISSWETSAPDFKRCL